MHASWQHTVPAPFSLVAHYDHPIAYLVHVFLPTYLPTVLLRFHLLTYLLYLAVVSLEETLAYSGYNILPSAFILGGIARRQEKHLMGGGHGNYGCFGLVDIAVGTSIGEDLMDHVIDEAEETQVAKKSQGKAKAAGNKAMRKVSKKKKKKNDDEERKEQEQGVESEAAENLDEEEEEQEEQEEQEEKKARPKPKTKGSSPDKSGKNRGKTYEEDTNGQSPEETNQTPPKRPSRTRRSEKKSSEEDAEAGGQDEDIKSDEEKPKVQAKGATRKGSQKSKAGRRPRKRSEEDDE